MNAQSKADAIARLLADARQLAARIAAEAPRSLIQIDTPSTRLWARADERRRAVERLSLEGKSVAEIAAAVGISYGYVVQLRGQLGVGRIR